jgi:hypothetical protein
LVRGGQADTLGSQKKRRVRPEGALPAMLGFANTRGPQRLPMTNRGHRINIGIYAYNSLTANGEGQI